MKVIGKALLWAFIIFHLVVIVFIPNRDSFLNAKVASVLLPYANSLGFNTAWQFFAPDPGAATYLVAQVKSGEQLLAEEYLPPEKDDFRFRQFFNRRIAAMRFLVKDPERARQVLVPYLCTKYPSATAVSIDKVVASVPSLDAVRAGGVLNDLSSRRADFFVGGDCDRGELVE